MSLMIKGIAALIQAQATQEYPGATVVVGAREKAKRVNQKAGGGPAGRIVILPTSIAPGGGSHLLHFEETEATGEAYDFECWGFLPGSDAYEDHYEIAQYMGDIVRRAMMKIGNLRSNFTGGKPLAPSQAPAEGAALSLSYVVFRPVSAFVQGPTPPLGGTPDYTNQLVTSIQIDPQVTR